MIIIQKYNDFVEVATETIADYKKEVNGKTVPMWTKEEVDEIVASQVRYNKFRSFMFKEIAFYTTEHIISRCGV